MLKDNEADLPGQGRSASKIRTHDSTIHPHESTRQDFLLELLGFIVTGMIATAHVQGDHGQVDRLIRIKDRLNRARRRA